MHLNDCFGQTRIAEFFLSTQTDRALSDLRKRGIGGERLCSRFAAALARGDRPRAKPSRDDAHALFALTIKLDLIEFASELSTERVGALFEAAKRARADLKRDIALCTAQFRSPNFEFSPFLVNALIERLRAHIQCEQSAAPRTSLLSLLGALFEAEPPSEIASNAAALLAEALRRDCDSPRALGRAIEFLVAHVAAAVRGADGRVAGEAFIAAPIGPRATAALIAALRRLIVGAADFVVDVAAAVAPIEELAFAARPTHCVAELLSCLRLLANGNALLVGECANRAFAHFRAHISAIIRDCPRAICEYVRLFDKAAAVGAFDLSLLFGAAAPISLFALAQTTLGAFARRRFAFVVAAPGALPPLRLAAETAELPSPTDRARLLKSLFALFETAFAGAAPPFSPSDARALADALGAETVAALPAETRKRAARHLRAIAVWTRAANCAERRIGSKANAQFEGMRANGIRETNQINAFDDLNGESAQITQTKIESENSVFITNFAETKISIAESEALCERRNAFFGAEPRKANGVFEAANAESESDGETLLFIKNK